MSIRLICLDADDTLWHNMRHFNAAEMALIRMLEPFADAHVTHARLIACEERNLPLYGYGAKGFTLSMIETALELIGDPVPPNVITEILSAGRALLAHPVQLFDGVAEALVELVAIAPLVLVTKGDLLHQETKLAASGLGDLFSGVEIVSDKRTETFSKLFARHGVMPSEAVMAGDAMRSDVLPALAAGAYAAFIPQEDGWSHERGNEPSNNAKYARLASLRALSAWIRTLE